uniref:Uncharacterized protein n=1 Tax=Utricularia reniformis TaxID=192314 RepID=A0A1Y0B2D0_9LAMI|nr:hypothetical protein AEK19_MT1308 [Utricularia reniformis]ART31509.1 hypothetical protein AEK19_MT1308 [Utricularia reniformis]
MESVCLVFYRLRGTTNLHCYYRAWTYNTLTQLGPWPHLDKTVMMWSTLEYRRLTGLPNRGPPRSKPK